MKLTPYFRNGLPTTDSHDALLPLRLAEDVRPNGYVVAYMRNGTALHVPASALLRLDARSSERRMRVPRWGLRMRRPSRAPSVRRTS
ncbi:MAG: hypothetical protein ACRDY6_23360 [Acidimicrobiia bacterium]